MGKNKPNIPSVEELQRLRTTRLGRSGTWESFEVRLMNVTPILGGTSRAGEIDDVTPVRASSIRGMLRMWWRALVLHTLESQDELRDKERELWGGTTGADAGGRSHVEVEVRDVALGDIDAGKVFDAPGGYALWPAQSRDGIKPRRAPGTRFTLVVRCPRDRAEEVRRAVCALVLFGGYGSRTRRGCGALTVTDAVAEWLPAQVDRDALEHLLGPGLFDVTGAVRADTPSLRGASLHAGTVGKDAVKVWDQALDVLRTFRQGAGLARDPGDARRPGRSRWPEPDKIRRAAATWPPEHEPRHDEQAAWPRAGFGLPIVGRFQNKRRDDDFYEPREPDDYRLVWRPAGRSTTVDRLASPLILKPLALAGGGFVPVALWLDRRVPDGAVVLDFTKGQRRGEQRGWDAPFERMLGAEDPTLFAPLAAAAAAPEGTRLRTAFLTWLRDERRWREVAP